MRLGRTMAIPGVFASQYFSEEGGLLLGTPSLHKSISLKATLLEGSGKLGMLTPNLLVRTAARAQLPSSDQPWAPATRGSPWATP